MKKKDARTFALYKALALVVIRHTHELFGEDVDNGSLWPLAASLECALGHTDDGPFLDSWFLEQLGLQTRHALRNPWEAGDESSRTEALLEVVCIDLGPMICGRPRLAKLAGQLLAHLLEREDDAKTFSAQVLAASNTLE